MTDSTYVYPQDTVTIKASYFAASVGDAVPAGQPETVEIILNGDAVPADLDDRFSLIEALVNTLFHGGDQDLTADVVVDPDPGEPAYDSGGDLPPGLTAVTNNTGAAEAVTQ